MTRVLTLGYDAVMAGATGAKHLRVVDRHHRRERCVGVAVLADICRLHVRRVFARGVYAVVALNAVVDDVYVTERSGRERGGRMTVIAVIAGGNVRRVFARCRDAVMAGAAGTEHLRMVDREHGREHIACMTVLTNVGGLNVGQVLAGRLNAVVAANAVARDVHVVKIRR